MWKTYKLLKRLLVLGVLLAVLFIVLSLTSGGDWFRHVSKSMKDTTDQVSETADMIKDTGEEMKTLAGEAVDSVKEVGRKMKDTAGETKKAGEKIDSTIAE